MLQVTGAGRGLGKGLAMSLAKEGCKLAVADINRVDAEQTAAEIIAAGGVAKVPLSTVIQISNNLCRVNLIFYSAMIKVC